MYTVGELEKLHPNGRVNYKGSVTRADGSDESSEKALQASLNLEKAMLCLGGGVDESEDESDIEQALEDLLDAQIACDEDYSDSEQEDEGGEEEEGDDGIPLDLPIPKHVLNVDSNRKRTRSSSDSEEEEEEVRCDSLASDGGSMKKKHKEMAERNVKEDTETSGGGAPPNFRYDHFSHLLAHA